MSTKLVSYLEETASGRRTTVRQKIMDLLLNRSKGYTRFEIATALNLRLSSVCGRINEILYDGMAEVVGEKEDPQTRKIVEIIGIGRE